ncbi:acyl-CoA dehydrogenase [Kitasatospora sp. NE20-6]|uniref:acyl-CoA dehydrogenase family protein n=1 Tax=Kitasatospora sp. NE20-6 TaxID=2859066 RepID=UPI0034DC307D
MTDVLDRLAAPAEQLEQRLGPADDPANPYGFAAAARRDDAGAYPDDLAAALRSAGFHLDYLPAGMGGTFASFDRSLLLVRAAARRDLNAMPATMFSVTAATCVRLHGSAAQQAQVAGLLRAGGAVAFALSEAEHGSDLLANTTRLVPDPAGGGHLLTGEKWMVGLGQRCDAAYVVARTGERGPGAFTAVLLDLATAGPGLDRGAPVPTGGMRGIDFAHLRFDRLPVAAEQVVGRPGEALEVAVKAQQVVRLMSTAGSLGCADTALRLTLGFAAGRRTGRAVLLDTPYQRRELAVASAALLAADAVALAAARGIHAAPEQFSVWGCAAKHVVAEAVEDAVARCGATLATRAVLRAEGPGGGLFQKLQRDAALVRVVDTSTLANLRSFSGQLPALARAGTVTADDDRARAVFALDAPLPPYDPARLDLNARGRDLPTGTLGAVAAPAAAALAEGGAPAVAALAEQLHAALLALPAEAEQARPGNELVDLAERFAWLQAGACCLQLWWASRHLPLYGQKPGSAGWLGACLAYLLARADGRPPRRAAELLAPALDTVLDLTAAGRMYAAAPAALA